MRRSLLSRSQIARSLLGVWLLICLTWAPLASAQAPAASSPTSEADDQLPDHVIEEIPAPPPTQTPGQGSFTVGPGPERDVLPTIRAVKVEGLRTAQALRVEILARPLLDQPAEEARVDEVLRSLSNQQGLGAFDVSIVQAGSVATVIFTHTGPMQLVEGILLDTSPEDRADPDPRLSALMWRQLQATDHALVTTEGHAFHPYWLNRDVESIRRYFMESGHLDVKVTPLLRGNGQLIEVVFHITPGPQYSTGEITRRGPTAASRRAARSVSLRVERSAPTPWHLRADAHRIRKAICMYGGHADATVKVSVEEVGESWPVTFEVDPGPTRRVHSVIFTHQSLPPSFLSKHGISAGALYCPDALVDLEAAIRDRLRDEGFPDPKIDLRARALPLAERTPQNADRVDVVLSVQPRTQAVIQRIWFEGNAVTQEPVLRSLVVVRDGDIFNQTAIDRSVQNLLRSGLFRRAYARVIDGGNGRYFLYFVVKEREFLSLSFQNQEVTFYNMDLTRPPGLSELTDGVSIRGRGQQLSVRAKKDHQRIRFRDPFLFDNMVTQLDLESRSFGFSSLEETIWGVSLGLGFRALENRLTLIPVLAVETLMTDAPSYYASLPVRGDDHLRVLWGLESTIDLRLVDAERFPYLGALFSVSARNIGFPGTGKPDVLRLRTSGRFFAPLGKNRTGQRYVLQLHTQGDWRFTEEEARLTAFERAAPEIRGYDREAHYLPNEVRYTDESGRLQIEQVMLGGTEAYSGSLSLRMPLFNQRRTALVPFIDAVTVGDPRIPAFEKIYTGVGAQLRFSLFRERLEGYIYLAYPLNESSEADFFGSGAGGSF